MCCGRPKEESPTQFWQGMVRDAFLKEMALEQEGGAEDVIPNVGQGM